jgi:hypothetical protein
VSALVTWGVGGKNGFIMGCRKCIEGMAATGAKKRWQSVWPKQWGVHLQTCRKCTSNAPVIVLGTRGWSEGGWGWGVGCGGGAHLQACKRCTCEW